MALLLGSGPCPDAAASPSSAIRAAPGSPPPTPATAPGLAVPELTARIQAALRQVVDTNAAVANPIDLVASATPEVYEQALRLVLSDERVDAAMVICAPTFAAPPPALRC